MRVVKKQASQNSPPDPLLSTGNGATASRTDPRFPAPGSRMTAVYTNSLKIYVYRRFRVVRSP